MRTLEISPKENFHRLHQALQEMLGNEPAQMAKFLLADEEWDPFLGVEVDDSRSKSNEDLTEKSIGEYLNQNGDRLIYEFDTIGNRSLFLELASSSKGKRKAPIITESIGSLPETEIPEKKRFEESEAVFTEQFDSGEFDDYTELFGENDDFF